MKILKKRVLAVCIDCFILASAVAVCQMVIGDPFPEISKALLPLIFIPLFFRDALFKNASIGKKVVGIAIYNDDWKNPGVKTLVKRSFLTFTLGFVLFWKSIFVDESKISVFDLEREKLGTRVIDKKVYKELSFIAKDMDGDFATNMTELYNKYLRGIYMK